jgi:hypothetical protein
MQRLLLALGISCAFFGTAYAKTCDGGTCGNCPNQAISYNESEDEEGDENYNETILFAAASSGVGQGSSGEQMGQGSSGRMGQVPVMGQDPGMDQDPSMGQDPSMCQDKKDKDKVNKKQGSMNPVKILV